MIRLAAGLIVVLVVAAFAQNDQARSPLFSCGTDERLPSATPLEWRTIVLAGDGRLYRPCEGGSHPTDHRENRERALIDAGFRSPDAEQRWRAVQAIARNPHIAAVLTPRGLVVTLPDAGMPGGRSERFVVNDAIGGLIPPATPPMGITAACSARVQVVGESRWQPGLLFRALVDPSPLVQREAAFGIGQRLADPSLKPELVTAAIEELRACILRPIEPDVKGEILAALGLAPYAADNQGAAVQALLVRESQGATPIVLGAARGLEVLLRKNPAMASGEALVRLRELVTFGSRATNPPMLDPDARIRRLAMMALQAAGDADIKTIRAAVSDGDWQMRRIAAGRLNLSDPEQAGLGELLKADPVFQVRYDLLSAISRLASRTGVCAPIVDRFKDPSVAVAMRAMDVIPATCADLDEATTTLAEMADKLERADVPGGWRLPVRALAALARLKPTEAKARLGMALTHPVWQVRAAAATICVTLADEASAITLLRDLEPNVQTAALEALFRLKSAAVAPSAIVALKTGSDYQLLRMAALVLRGLPDEAKDEASSALLGALRRLTDQARDTSRDTRVAMLDRLLETMSPARTTDLLPYLADYDDEVVAAATKTFKALVGAGPAPPSAPAKRRRYPFQPPLEALTALPTEAVMQLEEGAVTLRLLPDVAPVTVARFATMATEGFYNGRTFHRVVPNFVVQGGSPGANEYSGTSRFMRDEVGPQAVHVRGAVGISTRGGDTGDGQIFIDLVDVPRLDRDYTVFAYVTQGMEFVDRLLEGAKIVSISVK